MPCVTPEPSYENRQIQRAAKLLLKVWDYQRVSAPAAEWVQHEAKDPLASNPNIVPMLCSALKGMTAADRDELLYGDARDPRRRDLASWWEQHLVDDAEREADEAFERNKQALRESGLAKLSPDEQKALGVQK